VYCSQRPVIWPSLRGERGPSSSMPTDRDCMLVNHEASNDPAPPSRSIYYIAWPLVGLASSTEQCVKMINVGLKGRLLTAQCNRAAIYIYVCVCVCV